MTAGDGTRSSGLVGVGFTLLIAALAIDFYFDVRARDAFSWMDPYQYYEFALGVLRGREPFNGFEVPSIFPFFLMPALAVTSSIPAGLWSNFAFTLLLLRSIHGLCRELALETPSPLVAALVVSSPLLLGLSRTLYTEYALTAVVAYVFLHWLRFSRSPDWATGFRFGLAFGLGFMLKMTVPLFLALPVAGVAIGRFARHRSKQGLAIIAAVLLPVALVLVIQGSVFPASLGYYASLGNTNLAVMRLIGPPEWLSWPSAAFYPGEIGRTMLFLLTPFLLVAAAVSLRRSGGAPWTDPGHRLAALWLWLLGPLLLLIAEPVKEPRHVAPCVVPAVLLVVLGIEALPSRRWRAASIALALSLAALQFIAVTVLHVETPYFLDGPLELEQVSESMGQPGAASAEAPGNGDVKPLIWKYDQNIAIAGFAGNEALAWTWYFFPAVVFDLETFAEPERFSGDLPFRSFEDLYLLSAFNTYNRRCGWRHYQETLSREAVVEHADFVIWKGDAAGEAARRFPDHEVVASIRRNDGLVRILRNHRASTTPYRELYARTFLERNPQLSGGERRVVGTELLWTAALERDPRKIEQVLREFPSLRQPGGPPRNIYWIGGYPAVAREAAERIRVGVRG